MTESEKHILDCWKENAVPWTRAIANEEIDSRIRLTNKAIISAINSCRPQKVLDIGCGEGWLCRALISTGIDCVGVDAIKDLVTHARALGPGHYDQVAYSQLGNYKPPFAVDLGVCNFSLLGNESVNEVFAALPTLLPTRGTFIVQTLHPDFCLPTVPGQDGWQEGSWSGFSSAFQNPAPWYYRTRSSWHELFEEYGFEIIKTLEPALPGADPGSIIFVSRLRQ